MLLKKSITLSLIALLMLSLAPINMASFGQNPLNIQTVQAGALKDALQKLSQNTDYENLKTTILGLIDTALQKVDQMQANINANAKLSQQEKQNMTEALDRIETALRNYRARVEQAESREELKALNQEIIQYLLDNKDAIKESIRETIQKIGEKAVVKAEDLKKKLEIFVATLKLICPKEKATIEAIEAQIAQLKTEIASLQAALKAKDATTVKKELNDLSVLAQQIAANVQQVSNSCTVK